jgi:hypothetical protein
VIEALGSACEVHEQTAFMADNNAGAGRGPVNYPRLSETVPMTGEGDQELPVEGQEMYALSGAL